MKSLLLATLLVFTTLLHGQCDKTPDFNGDCQTDLSDFALFSGVISAYDLNCDGAVDQMDLDIVIDNFGQSACPEIRIFLVNANTNQDIIEIVGNGETYSGIDLSVPLAVRADVPNNSESVHFNFLNGALTRTENVAPYALFGDNGGNYNGQVFEEGSYFVEIQAFSSDNGNGDLLIQDSFNWNFFNQ
jgi:hypothetical protein